LSARSICNGLFYADNLMAFRARSETMTGAIHFVLWPQANLRRSILAFSSSSFQPGRIAQTSQPESRQTRKRGANTFGREAVCSPLQLALGIIKKRYIRNRQTAIG